MAGDAIDTGRVSIINIVPDLTCIPVCSRRILWMEYDEVPTESQGDDERNTRLPWPNFNRP